MTSASKLFLPCLFIAFLAVGCQKNFEMGLTNTTDRDVTVVLSAPGNSDMDFDIGSGQMLKTTLSIKKDLLPANCSVDVNAGKLNKKFTLTDEMPDKLWIDITPDGIQGPRDRKTEIRRTTKTEVKVPTGQKMTLPDTD